MALTLWDKFLPLIAPDLPGCPTASIETALAAAAAEFCTETHLWRETLDPETTAVGEALYPLTASGVVESVESLVLDGTRLEHIHPGQSDPESLLDTGRPRAFWLETDDSVRLFPIPDAAYAFTAVLILKPSRAAKGVEQFLYETHAETIVSGAIYRLTRIPNKSWSSPDLAAFHRQLFERGITDARVRDYRHITLRVTPQSF